ncbi:MAG: hypothetical protein KH317_00875 [Clostridiales bacterium]|nr:hypothetical protein [Clostridiales bacterium]
MIQYKTKCMYGYTILGERPPQLDNNAEYVIIEQSKFFLIVLLYSDWMENPFEGKNAGLFL